MVSAYFERGRLCQLLRGSAKSRQCAMAAKRRVPILEYEKVYITKFSRHHVDRPHSSWMGSRWGRRRRGPWRIWWRRTLRRRWRLPQRWRAWTNEPWSALLFRGASSIWASCLCQISRQVNQSIGNPLGASNRRIESATESYCLKPGPRSSDFAFASRERQESHLCASRRQCAP